MPIQKGDFVKVLKGEFKGEIGKVIEIKKAKLNRIFVDVMGVQIRVSHLDIELI